MAGTFDISTINVISPNGLVTKPLTVDNYGYAKIGDERVGVTPQNWIINGQFDVWQRGTSQTNDTYGSADMWMLFKNGATASISKQTFAYGQTEVPNNPANYLRLQSTVASANVILDQRIEDVTKLSGKQLSISFWAKADYNNTVNLQYYQSFGSGGSATNLVPLTSFNLTTTWQRFTFTFNSAGVSGKTIGANNYFNIRFINPDSETFTFDFANVCLVEGSVPVECPNEPYAEVLRKCQRYYYKINSADSSGAYLRYGLLYCATTTVVNCMINCPVTMRTYPTSIEYSGSFVIYTANNQIAVTSISLGTDGSHQNVLLLGANVASGLTSGYSGALMSAGNKTSYLAFSAEL